MIDNKVILVTGGTGSLGQAFIAEALKYNPKSIRVFSRSEYLQQEMQRKFNNPHLRFLIGDIRDKDRVYRAMNGVDYVIHAAALKQVPSCEYNPIEAVRTNIDGSINIIDAAVDNQVSKVLGISSDKAVHPISLYGATKLVMEKLLLQANIYGKTKFSCIRYGNFWGSRGSVIPLWLEQGKEITITNGEMTRYWIKIEDVAKFTFDCLERMQGAEIFIPKMIQKTMAQLAKEVSPDAKLKVTGKRVGEKKHELLFAEGEQTYLTETPSCYIIQSEVVGGNTALSALSGSSITGLEVF